MEGAIMPIEQVTHNMLLATMVLAGVFTEKELNQFLEDKAGSPPPPEWNAMIAEIREWKAANKPSLLKKLGFRH
jgi:hypothetical protein